MSRSFFVFAALVAAAPAFAGPAGVIFNADTSYAAGPSGPASADFTVAHPSGAHAVLTPQVAIGENDFNWLKIPITLPISDSAGKISGVSVCIRTNSPTGSAFISQTRLTQQQVPGPSLVIFDDGTDRVDPAGGCYTASLGAPVAPGGVIQLSLKVVMNPGDSIDVSGGLITMAPR